MEHQRLGYETAIARTVAATSPFTWAFLNLERFATKAQARTRVAAWIDEYNRDLKHSSIGMRCPIDMISRCAPASQTRRLRHDQQRPARSRRQDDRAVLAGVKAKPSGWPAASLDGDCGGTGQHRSGAGSKEGQSIQICLTEFSTVSEDCRCAA